MVKKHISRRWICAWILAILTVAAAPTRADDYKPIIKDGWEILFDGKSTDAWDVDLSAGAWAIDKDGSLYVAHAGPNIYTKQRYCDYVLELDYRIVSGKKSNSGVFIRVHNKADEVNTGMEIQILDDDDYNVKHDALNAVGALYDMVPPAVPAANPVGEWNHYKITVNDNVVQVELNGKQIVDADLNKWTTPHQNPDGHHNKYPHAIGDLPREGFLGLQNYNGTPVWFKNVRIKPIGDRQAKYTGKEPIKDVLAKPEEAPSK